MAVCDFIQHSSVSDDGCSLFSLNGMLWWAADAVQMWWRGGQYKYSCEEGSINIPARHGIGARSLFY